MELKFEQQDIDHIARHLWGSSVVGGKFNPKINDPKDFLTKLSKWLMLKVNLDDLDWIYNEKSGGSFVEVLFCADEELKNIFNISPNKPFGYDGVIEITENLRSKVFKNNREGIEVNIIEGVDPSPTDYFVVQFKKQADEEGVFIATTYPGSIGPLFPGETSTEEEYLKSKEYWGNHAFIIFK